MMNRNHIESLEMNWIIKWKDRVKSLGSEVYGLYIASRDPRVPCYAKVLALAVVAYALSPIDLIPDFIPILGYVDDLIIVPIGILLAIRMIPADVLIESRAKAKSANVGKLGWFAAGFVILVWLLGALALLIKLTGH